MTLETKNPLVAVWMVTYNHEKYIHQAINGVLAQQTSFPFRLYIGEDCSTDGTREICISYQKEFPDRIELLLTTENSFTRNSRNVYTACFNSGAKYIAMCEGDDYWTDLSKLQLQFDFLESTSRYCIVFHDYVIQKSIGGEDAFLPMKDVSKRDKTVFDIVKGSTLHVNTVMFSNRFGGLPDDFWRSNNGDTFLFACLAARTGLGAGYQENVKPSVYRMHSGGMWSIQTRILKWEQNLHTMVLIRKNIGLMYWPHIHYKITSIIWAILKNSYKTSSARGVMTGLKYLFLNFFGGRIRLIRPHE